jgi:tetratricopeptide (TPR) repeat protein
LPDTHNLLSHPSPLFKQQAIARIEELEAVEPLPPNLLNLKGISLMRLSKVDAALACFDEALVLDPDNEKAFSNRKGAWMLKSNFAAEEGNVNFRKGDYNLAMENYEKVSFDICGDDCKFQTLNNIGAIHMKRGQVELALASFAQALEMKPMSVETLHNSATALKILGPARCAESLEMFDRSPRSARRILLRPLRENGGLEHDEPLPRSPAMRGTSH